MTVYLIGLILGFFICVPVGPVNIAVIKAVLKGGFNPAFAIGLGGALMDLVYFLIVFFGLSYFTFSASTKLAFNIAGVLILIGFGVAELYRKPIYTNHSEIKITKKRTLIGFFFLGLILYTTNPTLIATISAIGASLKSFELFPDTTLNDILLAFGAGSGSILWYYTLISLVKKYKRKMTTEVLNKVNKACGVLILGLAAYVTLQLMEIL